MKTVTDLPHDIDLLDPVFIELSDGIRLAAKIWLPKDATQRPVPAILEYLPYRRTDGTAPRDATTHPYFAGHGYASIRVDMRGSGDSEGILLGEYLQSEQDDALEIIDWITQQPWCTGAVGMIGISWGGFNGLQVAARQPDALKAIVTICSTDDRYADDIHFMGGCMLMDNPWWNTYMFALNSAPPDPSVVGNRWKEIWMERLRGSGFWLEDWLQHQRRDEYWRHGSVCEDYSAIKAAVYAVGGWSDGYSNAVFRLLSNLDCPVKGLAGPWAHKYPHFAKPGPQIGFLQECLRWWDYWLKDIDTGIMEEPALCAYLQDPAPPQTFYEYREGRWATEDCWPSPRISNKNWYLNSAGLGLDPETSSDLSICSPMDVGSFGGHWCAFGLDPDLPGDQRGEMGGSLVFDSQALSEGIEILGAPVINLELRCDKPNAFVAAVLSEVMPDGSATRVSYGLLNLTHRDSHAEPSPLTPGKSYQVRLQLNECAHHFGQGNRIRVALSTSYWPIVWPSPEKAMLTLKSGVSTLMLPVRPKIASDTERVDFDPAEGTEPLNASQTAPPRFESSFTRDIVTGIVSHRQHIEDGETIFHDHDGWTTKSECEEVYAIHPDDPCSAKLDVVWKKSYRRGAWDVKSITRTTMTCTTTHFQVRAELEAFLGDERVYEQVWDFEVPRDHV